MRNRLEVICGPMYSGKTEELIRRLVREQIGGRNVMVFKSVIDDRYDKGPYLISHGGGKMEALLVDTSLEIEDPARHADVVGIDEVQFFDEDIIPVITALVSDGKKVVVSGLDTTYRREPFGPMPYLMAIAEGVTKLTAVCHKCGEDAYFTQRLVDGEPATYDAPTIVVGARDSYEARCRKCYESG